MTKILSYATLEIVLLNIIKIKILMKSKSHEIASNISQEPNFEKSPEPADRFRVNADDYPIFQQQTELSPNWGDNTTHRWNIDKTLGEYIKSTANLISTLDGTSAEYERHPDLPIPDHVIYLDKSARPVSWLINTFWQDFSDQKRPEHSYLNIDRIPWFRRSGIDVDPNGYHQNPNGTLTLAKPSDFHIENIDPSNFARIRALYFENGLPNDSIEPENISQIMHTPSKLDGKNILIVDEVRRSGSTAYIAESLIKAAFPNVASVRSDYFWNSGSKSNQSGNESQILSVPVWYDSTVISGRGIGDVMPEYYNARHEQWQNDKTRAQKFGSIVLSAMIDLGQEDGQRSRKLMHEIQQMRQDFVNGHILMPKPTNYDPDRYADFIEAQDIRLAPESDPSPDTLINILKAINARPAT